MVFDKRVELLTLRETSPHRWEWVIAGRAWACPEPQKGSNLFSKVGLGARSTLFSMHPHRLDLYQAIRWRDQQYFLTAIDRKSPMLMEVMSAQVEIRRCKAVTTSAGVDQDKRPVFSPKITADFPAALTEKYQGFDQREPMSSVKATYVLVTPKPVALEPGQLVEAEGMGRFVVQFCHRLDRYKNEYELFREEEV